MWVLPAYSLGGDLLQLALSVRQSSVEFLGALHDGLSINTKTNALSNLCTQRFPYQESETYLVLAERP